MENCLVTKLKAHINRDDLLVLGTLRFYIENPDGTYPFTLTFGYMKSGNKLRLKFDEEINQFTDRTYAQAIGSELTPNDDTSIYLKMQKAGWLSVYSKYDAVEILNYFNKGIFCRTKDFRGMYEITTIQLENCIGDIENFDINKDIICLGFGCDSKRGYKEGMTYGDITNLSKYTKLQLLSIAGSSIKGNIEDLYPLVESTEINITYAKQIFGDIKVLADKMYQAGRTSGTLKIWTAGEHNDNKENVTYNGEYFTYRVWTIVFSEDGHSDTNTRD